MICRLYILITNRHFLHGSFSSVVIVIIIIITEFIRHFCTSLLLPNLSLSLDCNWRYRSSACRLYIKVSRTPSTRKTSSTKLMASSVEIDRRLSDPMPGRVGPGGLGLRELFLFGVKRSGSFYAVCYCGS